MGARPLHRDYTSYKILSVLWPSTEICSNMQAKHHFGNISTGAEFTIGHSNQMSPGLKNHLVVSASLWMPPHWLVSNHSNKNCTTY